MPGILVLNTPFFSLKDTLFNQIQGIAPGYTINRFSQKDVPADVLENAEIILGLPDRMQISQAKKLKWLQLVSAGADRFVDRSMYCSKDVVLTNASGVFGIPISEHILAMILMHNRNIDMFQRKKAERIWEKNYNAKDFYGSVVGVIGLGDIGSEVAKRSKALGAKVIAVKRVPSEKPDYVDELYGEEGMDLLLEQSDYVVLALPSTSKTKGIITEERINRMKNDAFIVNIGRGALIDQDALIKALRENRIGGAGLDVTTPEPLPEDSPLWTLDNVILTPHVSGSSPSNTERRFGIFSDNLKRYLQGKPLKNVVDFEAGY